MMPTSSDVRVENALNSQGVMAFRHKGTHEIRYVLDGSKHDESQWEDVLVLPVPTASNGEGPQPYPNAKVAYFDEQYVRHLATAQSDRLRKAVENYIVRALRAPCAEQLIIDLEKLGLAISDEARERIEAWADELSQHATSTHGPEQVSRYTIGEDPRSAIHIERVGQRAGAPLWAVRKSGECLSVSGEWDQEPSPSRRDSDWLSCFRFRTAEAALSAARAAHFSSVATSTTLSIGESE
jgi:hypothetical protein